MAYRDLVRAHGATHLWTLDETTGTIAADLINASANGTIAGGVTLNVPSPVIGGGTAMTFNGTTGYVSAPVTALGTTFAIEAWIKTTSSAFMEIAEIGNIQFYVNGGTLGANVGGVSINSLFPVADNVWHHVVLVSNGTVGAVYCDGTFKASSAAVAVMPGTTFFIGRYYGSAVNFFNGSLDEVAIYPTVLTLPQINAHYVAGTTTLDRYATTVLTHSPSNYWRLNETSGAVAADLVGAAPGTISGGVTLAQPGQVGTAMLFAGAGQIATTPAVVSTPVAVTVEIWAQSTFRTPSFMTAFSSRAGGGSGDFVFVGLNQAGAVVHAFLYNGATAQVIVEGTREVADGAWHHLVFVLDGVNGRIYVDGVLDATLATSRTISGSDAVYIGREVVAGREWRGSLDEVAIYPTALTPAQIAQHYAQGVGLLTNAYAQKVVADGASNYWRLNEASGTTALDAIGGAHGTISGGVTLNQPGQVEKAMLFGGVDGKIAIPAPFTVPLVCTVEAWINYGANPQGVKMFFLTRGLVGATGDTIAVGVSGATGTGPLGAFSGAGSAIGTIQVLAGKWTHCAYVFTGTTVSLYVNGVFDRTQPLARTTPSTGPAQMGFDPGVYAYLGTVDEVALYPLALTPTQIAAHAAAGTAGWPGVPWWTDFDEDDMNNPANLYEPITPSDAADFKRGLTLAIWVGGGGDVAAVTQSGVPTVFAAVPAGAWLPLAARRINATGTTATGLVALYRV